MENIDMSLIDWSRAQFALTAIYHWIFVPLTLGLALVMAIMETIYYRTKNDFWKQTAKYWQTLFGINFAVGVATGLILEFEFGTNWSNYSWFVGDIFGAPLAIEGIVANSWMQYPVGMEFNPDTARNEMVDFMAVAFSPMAVNKFCHTVLSGWVLGSIFVVGVSCWYLLKKRDKEKDFALKSIKIGAWTGLVAAGLCALTGDGAGYEVAQRQPMKLAAMEGYYEGEEGAGLVAFGILNPAKETPTDSVDPFLFRIEVPHMLSLLAERDPEAFVPGIKNILEGGYTQKDGTVALSVEEKIARGRNAITVFSHYRIAKAEGDTATAIAARETLEENMPYFGYGYIKNAEDVVPNVPLTFYMFRIMVMLGGYFILFFMVVLFLVYKKDLSRMKWMHWVALLTIPLGYIAGQAGWAVAECGRQPWVIQDMLPTNVAVSQLSTSSVQLTFFIFLFLFTVMLIAEIGIMCKTIKKGPKL